MYGDIASSPAIANSGFHWFDCAAATPCTCRSLWSVISGAACPCTEIGRSSAIIGGFAPLPGQPFADRGHPLSPCLPTGLHAAALPASVLPGSVARAERRPNIGDVTKWQRLALRSWVQTGHTGRHDERQGGGCCTAIIENMQVGLGMATHSAHALRRFWTVGMQQNCCTRRSIPSGAASN
jgi:hypothetical protein